MIELKVSQMIKDPELGEVYIYWATEIEGDILFLGIRKDTLEIVGLRKNFITKYQRDNEFQENQKFIKILQEKNDELNEDLYLQRKRNKILESRIFVRESHTIQALNLLRELIKNDHVFLPVREQTNDRINALIEQINNDKEEEEKNDVR